MVRLHPSRGTVRRHRASSSRLRARHPEHPPYCCKVSLEALHISMVKLCHIWRASSSRCWKGWNHLLKSHSASTSSDIHLLKAVGHDCTLLAQIEESGIDEEITRKSYWNVPQDEDFWCVCQYWISAERIWKVQDNLLEAGGSISW